MRHPIELINVAVTLLVLSVLPGAVEAQVTESRTLTYAGARRIAEAAQAEAQRRGIGGAIAVVGVDGAVLHASRLDGTFPAAAEVAVRKARTAAAFQRPTSAFETAVNSGRPALLAALPDFTPMRGGVPILVGDSVVGAIGVSGARSAAEDEELAIYGAGFAASFQIVDDADPHAIAFFTGSAVKKAFINGAPLIETPDYKVHASHREGPGDAEIHTLETDIFYVISGSAHFVTGGTLVDPRDISPGELRGSRLEGGKERRIQAGDVIIIPKGTPHWFRDVNGAIDYYVVKVL